MRTASCLLATGRTPAHPLPRTGFFLCATCRTTTAARSFFSSAAPSAPPPPSGLVALASRRLLSISGPDAPKFLQGIITQNILAAAPATTSTSTSTTTTTTATTSQVRQDGFYSAFLTATGRVLYDVFIYPDHRQPPAATSPSATTSTTTPGETFLIEVDAGEAPRLERHIKRYKLRARFSVRLLAPDEATVWHAWDAPDGRAALDAATAGVEDFHRFVHMRDPRAPGLGWRMVKAGDREPLVDLPRVVADADADAEDVYRVRRYLAGVAEGPRELLREAALPLEGNLDVMGAIDFRKGCYVGQELTIRTKHRGVVRKRVLPVMLYDAGEGTPGPPPGELVYRRPAAGGDGLVVVDAAEIPPDTSIGRVGKKGRSAGKWLRGVGNVGLALCRLETMTDIVLPGETTAAATFSPADEFVMEKLQLGDGEGGEAAGGGGFKVKVKAFVPEWLRKGIDQGNAGQH